MEQDKSPVASTPAMFQALNAVDTTVEARQVPSPLMASDLRDDEQSTILRGSMEDLSLITQPGDQMDLTNTGPEGIGGEMRSPTPTPQSTVARRTRSHDNPPADTESRRKLISPPEPSAEPQEDYAGSTEETYEIVDLSAMEEILEDRRRLYSIVDKLNRTHVVEEAGEDSPQLKVYN